MTDILSKTEENWHGFTSEWFVIETPEELARHVESMARSVIGGYDGVVALGRPRRQVDGKLFVVVGASANTALNRKLFAKSAAKKIAADVDKRCTITACHVEDDAGAPGVPVSPDKMQDQLTPGYTPMGESKASDVVPAGMLSPEMEAFNAELLTGRIVEDVVMKGEL